MSRELVTSDLRRETELLLMWLGGGLFLIVLWGMLIADQVNLLCAVVIAIPMLLLAVYDKESAVLWTLVYLILLGDIRRIVAEIAAPSTFDPLLLIPPAVTAVLVVPLLFGLKLREPLSKAVLGLLVVMGLEVLNPKQGGLYIGLSGIFFYMIPVMWFWIGRSLGSVALVERIIYRLVLPLGISAGILGLCQNFIGFLPYQQAWIAEVGRVYTSLYVGSSVRAFGFSVSAAEYATLLEYAIALVVAAYFASRRLWMAAVPILATALLLSGGRGLTIKLVVVLCVLWVVRKGSRLNPSKLIGMAVLGGLALVSLSLIAGHFAGQRGGSAAQDALAHQLGGLAHPFDEKFSSAGLHSYMVTTGFLEGLTSPLGHGLGSTTFAAQKFGADSDEGSSELDFSDMFISLGLAGGLLYLGVAVFGIRAAFRYVRETRLSVGLPVLAILIATLGGWLIEGQYSTCSLVFFILGSVVHQRRACGASEWNSSIERRV
ncbi:hypothetical protein [Tunturiibacter gelidiferens]|uniref:hypothetical protein n=1 Tax=Tunturiibacter gelidiferens TaxID=3069689 RepID=UPI003D9BCE6A